MMNRSFLTLSTVALLCGVAGAGVLAYNHTGPDQTRATLVSVAEEFCSGGEMAFDVRPDPGQDIDALIAGMNNIAPQQRSIAICTRARQKIYAYDTASENATRLRN